MNLKRDLVSIEKLKQEGNNYFQHGKFENAIAKYNTALAWDKTNVILLRNKGFCYKNLGQDSLASNAFFEVLFLNPDDLKALFNLIEISPLFSLNSVKLAIKQSSNKPELVKLLAEELAQKNEKTKFRFNLAAAWCSEFGWHKVQSNATKANMHYAAAK